MAKNADFEKGDRLSVVCSDPATPASGDPVRVGALCGVANTNKRTDNTTSVQFRGVFDISVKGIDQVGNSAVAVGDTLYYTDGDTPKVSKKNTGTKFGTALGAVNSAATKTIPVRLAGSP